MRKAPSLHVVGDAPQPSAPANPVQVLLVRPPFFSPMTPPLGVGMLKAFLERRGHVVRTFDWNVDPDLWTTQRKYFAALTALDRAKIVDGDSKLWSVLNIHMLTYLSGVSSARCEKTVRTVAGYYGMRLDEYDSSELHGLITRFFARLSQLVDSLDLSGVSFAGTSTYSTSLAPSLFVLRALKARFPQVTTVMGGGVFADDLAIGSENLDILLANFDFVDHVVLGEGELLFQRLVEGDFADKRMISLADLGKDELAIGTLPAPDFGDFDMGRYLQLSIEGGRSCPFQCSFCSETIQWGGYRKKPAALLAEQMIGLSQKHGQNRFFMGDSLVNPYVTQLSEELLERNANLLYDGYLRADKAVGNPERVEGWARSGLYRTRLGLETASARILKLMDKMTTPESIFNALRSLAENGVRTATTWIVGHPGETNEDFEETLAFVREAHPFIYDLHAHPFSYYPYGQVGSRLYEGKSVFPDEVISLTKFKTWDAADVVPDRAERFARLSRFSALAADLEIPRTYSMAERYTAESRWTKLSPRAREVY